MNPHQHIQVTILRLIHDTVKELCNRYNMSQVDLLTALVAYTILMSDDDRQKVLYQGHVIATNLKLGAELSLDMTEVELKNAILEMVSDVQETDENI